MLTKIKELYNNAVKGLRERYLTHAAIGTLLMGPVTALFVWAGPALSAAVAVALMYYMREIRQAQEKGKSWQDTYFIWRYDEWDRKQTYRLLMALFVANIIAYQLVN